MTGWMVEKGARNFCFLSRSAGDTEKHRSFLEELDVSGLLRGGSSEAVLQTWLMSRELSQLHRRLLRASSRCP